MMAPQSKMGMKTASANLFLQVNGMDLEWTTMENLICFDKGKHVFTSCLLRELNASLSSIQMPRDLNAETRSGNDV